VGHVLRFSGLLGVEARLDRVSQSDIKTGESATTGGACVTIAEVGRRQVEDERVDAMGYVRPCYPTFTVFNVLGRRGIVVI
jgi:riboflavin synthase alpha subunit